MTKKARKLNVYVLMGGASAEHEISLKTGQEVLRHLDSGRFNARPVLIAKTGQWFLPKYSHTVRMLPEYANQIRKSDFQKLVNIQEVGLPKHRAVAFIAMHGPYGEDGTIQGLLELAGIPYTGSGVLASALGMDKVKSVEIFQRYGVLVPRFVTFTKSDWRKNRATLTAGIRKLRYPIVVKPQDQGSSVGITIVPAQKKLYPAVSLAFRYSPRVVVQQYIRGREVTCAVIDGGIPGTEMALQPTEIIPKTSKFFDYHAKYTPGATEEITPPKLPKSIIKKIQKTALTCHRALGCSGMSRTDMIVGSGQGAGRRRKIYVLEVNTIPGMTETSLLPQAAKACGIEFPELLERIIKAGINRFREVNHEYS